ncbi:MAG TPA: type II CAAX endopeptidase family protein [Sphingomonas sp.]|uniref:CPBP family intramembrane glutamic endopeptidase n=1 Tax=Sphingomonas sp. TaxID=28214 RepID=UPI002C75B1D5|nr:type II CAAX endopeptidase family protein [Sphingomonas sp.]HMI20710.1 type II CAAX endopeptidase family protein [Sphingomonas sp.]
MVVIGSAGVLAPGKWRWLRALGWLVLLCVAIVIVFNLVAKAMLLLLVWAGGLQVTQTSPAPAAYRLVAAIAGSIALVATYWAAVRLGERRTVPELDLRRAPSDLLLGLGVGAALLTTVIGVQWSFGWVIIEPRTVDRVALALRDSIRSGVLEELVLRLVIFRMLWRAFGIWPAIAGAALLFGALHLANPDSSPFAAACLIAGEGIGIGLYLITGRIWSAIGMHAAWNFTQGWIFGAAVSGITEIAGGPLALRPAPGVPAVLSGGGFGPEASLAALIVSLLASGALLFWAWRNGAFVALDA